MSALLSITPALVLLFAYGFGVESYLAYVQRRIDARLSYTLLMGRATRLGCGPSYT